MHTSHIQSQSLFSYSTRFIAMLQTQPATELFPCKFDEQTNTIYTQQQNCLLLPARCILKMNKKVQTIFEQK